jgi:hypothetical protein
VLFGGCHIAGDPAARTLKLLAAKKSWCHPSPKFFARTFYALPLRYVSAGALEFAPSRKGRGELSTHAVADVRI